MSFKRQLWTSGYEYRVRCPQCGTYISYRDNQLQYRSWYPNGFIYCPRCNNPLRHHEAFAVNPDGTPVYKSIEEANQAIYTGYNRAMGITLPRTNAQSAAQQYQNNQTAYCPQCGKQYVKGTAHFCAGCGNKLD